LIKVLISFLFLINNLLEFFLSRNISNKPARSGKAKQLERKTK